MKITNIITSLTGIVFAVIAISSLKPSSGMAFTIFALWLSSPFIATLVLSFMHKNTLGVGVGVYGSLLIGLLLFMDIRYWHPDPQGGVAVLGLPVVLFAVIIGAMLLIKKEKKDAST